jgi:uncharacterized protein DUF5069
MTPLDLSTRRPRPVREQLAGIAYLPRAIDKVRAQLPGGRLGPYVVLTDGVRTLSAGMYHLFGFTHEEFTDAVAGAQDESAVAAWVRARVGDEAVAKWNDAVLTRRIADITGTTRERMLAGHPCAADMAPDALLVDMFDADDEATYARI